MNEKITFNDLPKAVSELTKEVSQLKSLLIKSNSEPTTPSEKLLNIQEAANFLNLSVSTIYTKVSKGTIPYMKQGKRLYFSDKELLDYLKKGRRKSTAEIEQEAEKHLSNLKRK
jgi:excisionase family DNA binding protein